MAFQDFHRMVGEFMNEWGFDCTYVRALPSIPNDDDGTLISSTQEIPIRAIKMAVLGNMAGSRSKLGTMIQEADDVLYVQPSAYLNNLAESEYTDDWLVINGIHWEILAIREYDPSTDDCVLYELYIKR